MEERTTGLIIRTRRLTETSLIVNWLTADAGRISTVAKGALRPKSAFRGKLDVFYSAELTFVRSRRSELHTLKEVRLLETHGALRRDVDLLQQAAYTVALLELATERDTPQTEVYHLVTAFLTTLTARPWRPEAVLWFELKLLAELGLQPDPASARISPRTRKLVDEVFAADWNAAFSLKTDPGQVKELIQCLHGFLSYHLGKVPKGRAAALKAEFVGWCSIEQPSRNH